MTSPGPPHLLIPYKKQNGDSDRRVEASCLLLPLLIFTLGIRQKAKKTAA